MARLAVYVLAVLVLVNIFTAEAAPHNFRPGPVAFGGANRRPPVNISIAKSKSVSISSGGGGRPGFSGAQSSASSFARGG
uniref:SFRICE_011003 n=1 Tax=Spodoptera frugiperda TaxID=7108 RepID=A0A2H1V226_SPOFR